MREYDVTPQEQGSNCIYQNNCQFYLYGIYCNNCKHYEDLDDILINDEDYYA